MTSALNSTVHQRGAASPAPRRKRLNSTERLALLEREKFRCHLCHGEIQPGQAWDVSHEIPLELNGADDDENRRAAHRKCHRDYTATVDRPSATTPSIAAPMSPASRCAVEGGTR